MKLFLSKPTALLKTLNLNHLDDATTLGLTTLGLTTLGLTDFTLRAAVTDPPGFLYPPGAFFAKNRCMDCYELMYVRCPNISRVIGSRSFGGLC